MLKLFTNKNKKKQQNKAAFSIVEVITILLIIAIGMAGILTLITQSIRGQNLNKNTLVAYNLAQEGVELIRSVRDNNWKNGLAWDNNLANGRYIMDYTWATPLAIQARASEILAGSLFIDVDGFYHVIQDSLLPEGSYSRVILLNHEGDDKIKIRVNVYWYDRGRLNSYSLETDIYDWL